MKVKMLSQFREECDFGVKHCKFVYNTRSWIIPLKCQVCGSLSPRHGASWGCDWRTRL